MQVVETFGQYVQRWSGSHPDRARDLLRLGWEAQNLKNKYLPDRRLLPADQYLAKIMMDAMLKPLQHPASSAIVSVFTPSEILQEAGLNPYNVEGFSCYLSGSRAERLFLQQAENAGISETLCSYHKTFLGAADKDVPSDLVTPLYCGMVNNILLGSQQVENYVDRLRADIEKAPPARGKRIYWMHTIPFWSAAARQAPAFSEKAQIVGCELSQVCEPDFDPEEPFEAMAYRMVNHVLNGSGLRRIEAGIRHAKEAGADGVVWFNHWGCKHTLGAAQLAKKKFEEHGLPLLILDGDGCDRSHGGEGQTSTRLEAFLEMLEEGDGTL